MRLPTLARTFISESVCYRPLLTLRRAPVSVKREALDKGRPDARIAVVECCSHSCWVANQEGFIYLLMRFKGLEGVLRVWELGLFSHPLPCVPEPSRDSGQQGVSGVCIVRLVELSVELRIVETRPVANFPLPRGVSSSQC